MAIHSASSLQNIKEVNTITTQSGNILNGLTLSSTPTNANIITIMSNTKITPIEEVEKKTLIQVSFPSSFQFWKESSRELR